MVTTQTGIITDSHSNPWGQEAVIRRLRKEGIEKPDCVNLGDVVGMFPEAELTADMIQDACGTHILGNHDALFLGLFEDAPKREPERMAAIRENQKALTERPDITRWLDTLPLAYLDRTRGISFRHNSPFPPDFRERLFDQRTCEPYMHFRFGKAMDPKEKDNRILEVGEFEVQVVLRGHSHESRVYAVKREATTLEDAALTVTKLNGGLDFLYVPIDPDFNYIVTVGSAAGANTMFTKPEDVDHRPAGGIVEYDKATGRGKITLFRTTEGYDSRKFIESVERAEAWRGEVFKEAHKMVERLKDGK